MTMSLSIHKTHVEQVATGDPLEHSANAWVAEVVKHPAERGDEDIAASEDLCSSEFSTSER